MPIEASLEWSADWSCETTATILNEHDLNTSQERDLVSWTIQAAPFTSMGCIHYITQSI